MYLLWEERHQILNKIIFNETYVQHVSLFVPFLEFSRYYFNDPSKIMELQENALKILLWLERKIWLLKKNDTNPDEIYMYDRLRDIIKMILDWILWRVLKYNRAYISLLSYSKWPGYIKQDIEYSLKKIKNDYLIWTNIIIINDLTQSARVWDYLVINNNKLVNILETKGNWKIIKDIKSIQFQEKNTQWTNKQWKKILDTFQRINDNIDIKDIYIHRNYFSKIENIIKKAYESWCEVDRLNKHTSIRVIYANSINPINNWIKLTKKAKNLIKKDNNDEIMCFSNLDSFAKKNNRFSTLMLAPYSIFPFDEGVCMNLMSWILQLSTYINITSLKDEFIKNGWIIDESYKTDEVEISLEDINASNLIWENNIDTSIFKIRKQDGYYSIVTFQEILLICLEFRDYKEILVMHEKFYEESKKDKTDRHFSLNFPNDENIFC